MWHGDKDKIYRTTIFSSGLRHIRIESICFWCYLSQPLCSEKVLIFLFKILIFLLLLRMVNSLNTTDWLFVQFCSTSFNFDFFSVISWCFSFLLCPTFIYFFIFLPDSRITWHHSSTSNYIFINVRLLHIYFKLIYGHLSSLHHRYLLIENKPNTHGSHLSKSANFRFQVRLEDAYYLQFFLNA